MNLNYLNCENNLEIHNAVFHYTHSLPILNSHYGYSREYKVHAQGDIFYHL